jgi:hypothetical protein
MRILQIVVVALLVRALTAQQTSSSIEGVVVLQGSEAGLKGTVVSLLGAAGQSASTGTDNEGRFSFRNLQPGRYLLTTTLTGYVQTGFVEQGSAGAGRPLLLDSSQQLSGVHLQMVQTGVVSGRIRNRQQNPMGAVVVQALKISYENGQRVAVVARSEMSNDLGEYRLFGLTPGRYLINVLGPGVPNPSNGLVVNPTGTQIQLDIKETRTGVGVNAELPDLNPNEDYFPVFYPNVFDISNAVAIDVGAGAEVRGIDLIVTPSVVLPVRGSVADDATGQMASQAQIHLIPSFRGGIAYATVTDARGSFTFPKVLPGSYSLIALLGSPTSPSGRITRIRVEVRETPLELSVRLRPGGTVNGNVVAENGEKTAWGLPVSFSPADMIATFGTRVVTLLDGRSISPVSLVRETRSNASGVFGLRGLAPDTYRVSVRPDPRFYVKSIRAGETDVLREGLRIDSVSTEPIALEIVLAPAMSEILGRVENSRQTAVTGVPVVLVPRQSGRNRPDLYKCVITDAQGRFQMSGVAPGEYDLFAWANVENGSWFDPEFIRIHEDRGKRVRVGETTREEILVTVIDE